MSGVFRSVDAPIDMKQATVLQEAARDQENGRDRG